MSKAPSEACNKQSSRKSESVCTTGLMSRVSHAAKLLISNSRLVMPLVRLNKLCSKEDLKRGEGIYRSYMFSGNSGCLNIDKEKGFENMSDVSVFASGRFLFGLLDGGLDFNGIPEAREKLHDLIREMINDISISTESLENYHKAQKKALNEGKKLIVLANHISHFDAPFLDYIFKSRLLEDGTDIRMVCGAFMYYNANVRPFVRCFNTTFVFGPADSKEMMETIRSSEKEYFYLFRKIKEKFEQSLSSTSKREISLMFPYAGRADPSHDNYEVGCKDSIDPSMKTVLGLQNCIYLPFGMKGPGELFEDNPRGGGDMIRNLANSTKADVRLEFGEFYEGEQLKDGIINLNDIHESMIDISKKSFRI